MKMQSFEGHLFDTAIRLLVELLTKKSRVKLISVPRKYWTTLQLIIRHAAVCTFYLLWFGRVLWLFYHFLGVTGCFQHWLVSVQIYLLWHHDISVPCWQQLARVDSAKGKSSLFTVVGTSVAVPKFSLLTLLYVYICTNVCIGNG